MHKFTAIAMPCTLLATLTMCTPSGGNRDTATVGDSTNMYAATPARPGDDNLSGNTMGNSTLRGDTVQPGPGLGGTAGAATGGNTTGMDASGTGMAGTAMRPNMNNAGNPATAAAPMDDAAILAALSAGNTAEVTLGNEVRTKATRADVRRFAATLVQEHTKELEKGRTVARRLGVQLAQSAADDRQTTQMVNEAMQKLRGNTGENYDLQFLQHTIVEHQRKIEMARTQLAPNAKDPELRRMIEASIPAMEKHLEQARRLSTQAS